MSNQLPSAESYIDRCLKLYSNGEYFVRREISPEVEKEYWIRKRDPDGRQRNLENERAERRQDVAYIAAAVNALPAGRVLDVGCGLGELLEQIASHHELYGLDTSERSIEICRQHTSAKLFCGVLEDLTDRPSDCRSIIAHHVIEHVDDPIAFVETIFTMLAPGGTFVCGTPDFASAAARRFGDRFRLLHDPTHVSLFTEDSLIRLLRDSGFVIGQVEKPFFDTRFDTPKSYERMRSPEQGMSPPFYGSFLTVFANKPE